MTRLTSKRRSRHSPAEDAQSTAARAPFISRQLDTFGVLSQEGLELIEHNADLILQHTGMEFHGDPDREAEPERLGKRASGGGPRLRDPGSGAGLGVGDGAVPHIALPPGSVEATANKFASCAADQPNVLCVNSARSLSSDTQIEELN